MFFWVDDVEMLEMRVYIYNLDIYNRVLSYLWFGFNVIVLNKLIIVEIC